MQNKNAQWFPVISMTLVIVFLLWIANGTKKEPLAKPHQSAQITQIYPTSIKALQNYFSEIGYQWPITSPEEIPSKEIHRIPTDLSAIQNVSQKKSLFIRIMLPAILAEKKHLLEQRQLIHLLLNKTNELNKPEISRWLTQLSKEYKIFTKEKNNSDIEALLLNQIDVLPTTLILAQAAIESGWGTSRFAREGNSFFGQWTYEKNDGLVPNDRQEGKSHQVKAFNSIRASVRSYLKNINRNHAYRELREQRAKMRKENIELDAFILSEGLHRYSQKGKDYVTSLKQLLNSPEFKKINQLKI